MGAHDTIDVLVRRESADVGEPARLRRHARRTRGIDGFAGRARLEGARGGLARHTKALSRDAEDLLDLARGEVGHGEHERGLPQRQPHLRLPEELRAARRHRQLGKALGDRVVDRDQRALPRGQRKVRVHRRRPEHIWPIAPDRAGEPQHVGGGAIAVRGRGVRRRHPLRDVDELHVRCVQFERRAGGMVGVQDESMIGRDLHERAEQLASEAAIASPVGEARGVDTDPERGGHAAPSRHARPTAISIRDSASPTVRPNSQRSHPRSTT
jgi:hypothetical protein